MLHRNSIAENCPPGTFQLGDRFSQNNMVIAVDTNTTEFKQSFQELRPWDPIGGLQRPPSTPCSIFVPRVKYADSLAHRRLAAVETVERLKYHVF